MINLQKNRMKAALASMGISGDPIRKMVIDKLEELGSCGRLLDYGAGIGHLLHQIQENFTFEELSGADILPRPDTLSPSMSWYQQDLNEEFYSGCEFDVVISTEVIEHLENPRAMFRNIYRLLTPGGTAIITTPNQNSLRSVLALAFGGHFAAFLGASYPAHITALTNLDLERIALETGFVSKGLFFSNSGGLPKKPSTTWQTITLGILKGRLFSDNVGIVVQKSLSNI